jgi:hypothetical protein
LDGVTAIALRVAEVIVKLEELLTVPREAVMLAWPGDTPRATPLALTVATPELELQVTPAVTSR